MVLKLFYQSVTSLFLPFIGKNDRSFHNHTSHFIRYTSHCTLHNCGVCHHSTLYFERSNAVTRTLDDIISTSNKPVIAIFITPCEVTSVVQIVMPSLLCQLRITIITLKKTKRFTLRGVYTDLTFLSIFTLRAIRSQQFHIILWIRLSHTARLRLNPWERPERHTGFSLPESFHHLYTCQLVKPLENSRFKCFSSRSTIP